MFFMCCVCVGYVCFGDFLINIIFAADEETETKKDEISYPVKWERHD